jgi:two-component system NtrC family response regulator
VIHIDVPQLRERLDDIPLLVRHFVTKYKKDSGKDRVELSPEVWKRLYQYNWPGNVRQLENVMERAVILSRGETITLEDLPEDLRGAETEFDVDRFVPANVPLHVALEKIEEALIRRALRASHHVQAHAAEMLGITKSNIQHKMKKYGISA